MLSFVRSEIFQGRLVHNMIEKINENKDSNKVWYLYFHLKLYYYCLQSCSSHKYDNWGIDPKIHCAVFVSSPACTLGNLYAVVVALSEEVSEVWQHPQCHWISALVVFSGSCFSEFGVGWPYQDLRSRWSSWLPPSNSHHQSHWRVAVSAELWHLHSSPQRLPSGIACKWFNFPV